TPMRFFRRPVSRRARKIEGRNRSPAGSRAHVLFGGGNGQSGTCAATIYSFITYVRRTCAASRERAALSQKWAEWAEWPQSPAQPLVPRPLVRGPLGPSGPVGRVQGHSGAQVPQGTACPADDRLRPNRGGGSLDAPPRGRVDDGRAGPLSPRREAGCGTGRPGGSPGRRHVSRPGKS